MDNFRNQSYVSLSLAVDNVVDNLFSFWLLIIILLILFYFIIIIYLIN